MLNDAVKVSLRLAALFQFSGGHVQALEAFAFFHIAHARLFNAGINYKVK